MRRSVYQLITQVHDLFKERPTHCFNIDEIAKEVKITWRTSRNIVNLLKGLYVIRRVVIKKRELWIVVNPYASKWRGTEMESEKNE